MKTLLLYIYLNDFSEVPSIIIGLGCEHTVTQEKKMMNKQISIYITCLCFICTGHTPEVCKYMLQDIF